MKKRASNLKLLLKKYLEPDAQARTVVGTLGDLLHEENLALPAFPLPGFQKAAQSAAAVRRG